ncbi:MAG: hypothetical protein JXQ87_17085 [Bacteroidia bacterium]
MQDRNIKSEQESLEIITSMINQAKGNVGKNAAHYLLWGWLGLAASISQFILYQNDIWWHFIGWILMGPIGGIGAFILIRRATKTNVGHMDKVLGYLWMAFGFSILIILANGFVIGWGNAYVFLIILIGLATFVSGKVLKFHPLQFGGWFAWAMSGVAIYAGFEWAIISIALVMVVSYLVPGYLLKKKHG